MTETKQAQTIARRKANAAALAARIASQNHSAAFFSLAAKAIKAEYAARELERNIRTVTS
jgi:hypothetical protein